MNTFRNLGLVSLLLSSLCFAKYFETREDERRALHEKVRIEIKKEPQEEQRPYELSLIEVMSITDARDNSVQQKAVNFYIFNNILLTKEVRDIENKLGKAILVSEKTLTNKEGVVYYSRVLSAPSKFTNSNKAEVYLHDILTNLPPYTRIPILQNRPKPNKREHDSKYQII